MTLKTLKEKLDDIEGTDARALAQAVAWGNNALMVLHACAMSKGECFKIYGREFGNRLHAAYQNGEAADKFMLSVIRYWQKKVPPSARITAEALQEYWNSIEQINKEIEPFCVSDEVEDDEELQAA